MQAAKCSVFFFSHSDFSDGFIMLVQNIKSIAVSYQAFVTVAVYGLTPTRAVHESIVVASF